jgi:hypothetical protein
VKRLRWGLGVSIIGWDDPGRGEVKVVRLSVEKGARAKHEDDRRVCRTTSSVLARRIARE